MKKLWFIVVALALYAGPAAAQGKEKYKEKGGRREMAGAGWQMMDSLNLTAEQRTRITTINDTYRQRMDSLRNTNQGDADMRTQRETLMRQHMDEVRAVLTDEQRTRWEAMRPAGGGRFNEDGRGPGMMGGPGGNLDNLNLTQDQKTRVAAINQEFRQKMADLRNENLSGDEMRTRREALQQQHMESIRAVLTDEQRAKWNDGRNNKQGGDKKIKVKGDKYKEKTKTR